MSLLSSIVYILILHHFIVHTDASSKTVTASQAVFTTSYSPDYNIHTLHLEAGASSLGPSWAWMRFTHGLSSDSVISAVQLTVKLCDESICGMFNALTDSFQMQFYLCTFTFDGEIHIDYLHSLHHHHCFGRKKNLSPRLHSRAWILTCMNSRNFVFLSNPFSFLHKTKQTNKKQKEKQKKKFTFFFSAIVVRSLLGKRSMSALLFTS
jgi:hypothetical protein